MKLVKRLVFVFLTILLVLLASCSNDVSKVVDGTLVVNVSGSQGRGILPTISMVAGSYSITITDESDEVVATETIDASQSSVSYRLKAATYTVTVDAKNSDGTVIGTGTSYIAVKAGAVNSVVVNVTECSGNGTFAVSIQANSGYALTLKLYNSSNEVMYSGDLAYSDGVFATDGTVSIANGFYRFEITRKDTNVIIKNDSVRIVKGFTSSYSATFTFASDGTVSIVNEMVSVPTITISLNKTALSPAETLTATATVSGISDYTVCWFVDGVKVGDYGDYEDLSQSLSDFEVGDHEVALFVKNSQVFWSESVVFTVEDNTRSLVFPTFENSEYGSRGITNETVGNQEFFSGNPRLGGAVLQTTPLVPSLKSVSGIDVSLGILPPSVTVDFSVYGVTVRYVEHKFSATGIYVRYNIIEDESICGDIDYYFDWVDNSFSLREKIILNMPGLTYGLIMLEMRDVEVEKTLLGAITGNYKCGQFNASSSTLDDNARIHQISLYDPNDDDCAGGYHYNLNYVTINSSDGVISSILRPWEQKGYAKTESSDIQALIPDGYNCFDDFVIANETDNFNGIKEYMDYDYMKSVLSHLFTSESLILGSEKSEFNNAFNFLDLKSEYKTNLTTGGEFICPTIYTTSSKNKFDLAAKTGASCLMGGGQEILYHMKQELTDAINQYDNTMNYKAFYGSVENCASREAIAEYILDKHLRQCGITNENFIANFIAEEKKHYAAESRMFLVPVTNMDCDEFQALLDSAYAD